MHYLSQHGHDLNSQPQDACSVNLSDDEPDVALALPSLHGWGGLHKAGYLWL